MRRGIGRYLRLAGVLAATLSWSACASNPWSRRGEAPDEVAALKTRVVELQRQVTVHEIEIARLRERVSALAAGRPAVVPRSTRPAPAASSTPEPEVVTLPPPTSFEEDDLASEPETVPALAPEPARRASSAQKPAPPEAQALYDSGYSLVQQGRHTEAESRLRAFLDQHGDTELADNALYWIGESRYSRNDYAGALPVFQQAVERYPQGNKLADALLKVGLCLEKLGDQVGARDVLTEVARRFPGTAASATAQELLRTL